MPEEDVDVPDVQHGRGVFIGDSDTAQPPRDANYLTIEVKPGLYVGIQLGG